MKSETNSRGRNGLRPPQIWHSSVPTFEKMAVQIRIIKNEPAKICSIIHNSATHYLILSKFSRLVHYGLEIKADNDWRNRRPQVAVHH